MPASPAPAGRVIVLRGDAAHLPLPDASVDLIVTSPPYWGQRSYEDGGEVYDGQIGSEATPAEFIAALVNCTREWVRVLKSEGSIFVDLGDKYDSGTTTARVNPGTVKDGQGQGWHQGTPRVSAGRPKSLLLLPERYRIACADELGLIVREVIEWDKLNPLPESAADRCGRTHEDVVHLVKQPRYYAGCDEIREPHSEGTHPGRTRSVGNASGNGVRHRTFAGNTDGFNRLGKMPGSVWGIPSQPLTVPERLGVRHFAAFPMELPRRIILGWSPSGICTACGEGRRPIATQERETYFGHGRHRGGSRQLREGAAITGWRQDEKWSTVTSLVGYACACTPYTDHPGTGAATRRRDYNPNEGAFRPQGTYGRHQAGEYERVGPRREYRFEGWTAAPTRPAVVLDPFGGTGTTALVASVHGRTGVTVDRSADYCRIAAWRTSDPAERARALGVPKPPPVIDGQGSLFDGLEGATG